MQKHHNLYLFTYIILMSCTSCPTFLEVVQTHDDSRCAATEMAVHAPKVSLNVYVLITCHRPADRTRIVFSSRLMFF